MYFSRFDTILVHVQMYIGQVYDISRHSGYRRESDRRDM